MGQGDPRRQDQGGVKRIAHSWTALSLRTPRLCCGAEDLSFRVFARWHVPVAANSGYLDSGQTGMRRPSGWRSILTEVLSILRGRFGRVAARPIRAKPERVFLT